MILYSQLHNSNEILELLTIYLDWTPLIFKWKYIFFARTPLLIRLIMKYLFIYNMEFISEQEDRELHWFSLVTKSFISELIT